MPASASRYSLPFTSQTRQPRPCDIAIGRRPYVFITWGDEGTAVAAAFMRDSGGKGPKESGSTKVEPLKSDFRGRSGHHHCLFRIAVMKPWQPVVNRPEPRVIPEFRSYIR